MKIIFMGSPVFAVASLAELVQDNMDIILVYTQPPRPAGRGNKITKTAIHEYAQEVGLEVRHPERLRDDNEFEYFKSLNPDLVIVVAYGLIIPKRYLDIPKYGFINIHPSNLPKYRGAAPIQRTILGGDEQTALCIMQMDVGLDTGDVVSRTIIDISDKPTYQQLHDKLAKIGAKKLIEVIKNISSLQHEKQNDILSCYAAKLTKEEAQILASDELEIADRKVRALNPWPMAYIVIDGQIIKIIEAESQYLEHNKLPGTVIVEDNYLKIALKGGFLLPTILQRQGKNKLSIKEFIQGFDIQFDSVISK